MVPASRSRPFLGLLFVLCLLFAVRGVYSFYLPRGLPSSVLCVCSPPPCVSGAWGWFLVQCDVKLEFVALETQRPRTLRLWPSVDGREGVAQRLRAM